MNSTKSIAGRARTLRCVAKGLGCLLAVCLAFSAAVSTALAGQLAEIKRDRVGVPHCYDETPDAMMYAHGHAQEEDHL